MRILDRYVARYFASSLAISAATLALLFLLIDIVLNLDRLIADERGLAAALGSRALGQLPLIFQRFGAFVTLAGALFAVARLEANNELTPMLSAGVSVRRALLPVLVGALGLGGVEAVATELLVPALADTIREQGALGSGRDRRPGFLRDDRGSTLFAGSYDPTTETLRWVSFRERDAAGRLVRTLHADRAVWVRRSGRDDDGAWRLFAGWERREDGPEGGPGMREAGGGADPRLPVHLLTPLPDQGVDLATTILPIDIESLNERFSLLRMGELYRQAYQRQTYLTSLRVQLLTRFTSPLAHLCLVLLAVPFVLGVRGKASLALSVLLLLAIAALYFLATFFCHELGSAGTIPPWAAAALPPGLSAVGAAPLWLRARS
jgi:lipopolysaccharide export system permease protein